VILLFSEIIVRRKKKEEPLRRVHLWHILGEELERKGEGTPPQEFPVYK